jgi:hypothetical protein
MSTLHATPALTPRRRNTRWAFIAALTAVLAITISVVILTAGAPSPARPAAQSTPVGNFMGLHYRGNGALPSARIVQSTAGGPCSYDRPERRCVEIP